MGFFSKVRDNLDVRNFKVVEKGDYERVTQDHYSMRKAINDEYLHSNSRASTPYPFMDTPDGSKIPMWRVAPNRMYELADYVGDLRAVIETIQREMFRNGLQVIPRYHHKCLVCLKEYEQKPLKEYVSLQDAQNKAKEKLQCTECGNDNPRKWAKPDPKNRAILQALLDKRVNNNQQTLKIVARQAERDLDIIDGCYVLVTRKWAIKKLDRPDELTGATKEAVMSIEKSKLDEIIRVHPIQCSIIASDEAVLGIGADGKPRYICPQYQHRDTVLETPVCPKCGCKAFNAFMETNSVPYGVPLSSPKMYYAQREIVWIPGKYYPDVLYGNSPIQSVWKKVLSLMFQDEYMWKYFDKERPPKSLLVMGSRNQESVAAFMEKQRQGARQDPYMPRPILLNTENVSQALQFVDLTPNFKELELTEMRKELRQIISTVYGVQPLFYGEQAKAGLGNEALQVTLTNRTIKWFQRFLNEQFFDEISNIMEIYDWKIELVTSEEIDELREEQVRGQKIDNTVKLYGMGFDVAFDGENNILVSQYPNPEKQEMMMGGGMGTGENIGGGKNDKTKSSSPKKEGEAQKFDGEPKIARPSDKVGLGDGSPSSGTGTTLSNKAELVKNIKKGMNQSEWDKFLKEQVDKD